MARKQHTPEEKAQLVLEALRGERTINEIASSNNIHPNMLSKWKRDAESNLYTLFQDNAAKERREKKAHEEELQELYAQIGKLTTQNEWLKKNLVSELSVPERRLLVDMNAVDLPVSTQAELLGLNRSGLYYKPVSKSEDDLVVKLHIDKIYTAHPEYGYRRICWHLNEKDHIPINRKAVLRHMREMGIQAVYPRQNTSKAAPGNPIYPYLLKNLQITRPDQVWSIDITYIPIKTDWLYLVAIIDWFSRYVLDWRISDSMEIDFVLDVSHSALRHGIPEIMNSDQGSHFTSPKYTRIFLDAGAKISMDHRGRAYDNIFIERLWRSVKYEDVYPKAYDTPRDARIGIHNYMEHYNCERPHSSLGYKTPKDVYEDRP